MSAIYVQMGFWGAVASTAVAVAVITTLGALVFAWLGVNDRRGLRIHATATGAMLTLATVSVGLTHTVSGRWWWTLGAAWIGCCVLLLVAALRLRRAAPGGEHGAAVDPAIPANMDRSRS